MAPALKINGRALVLANAAATVVSWPFTAGGDLAKIVKGLPTFEDASLAHTSFKLALALLSGPRLALVLATAWPLRAPAVTVLGLLRPVALGTWAFTASGTDLHTGALRLYLGLSALYLVAVPLAQTLANRVSTHGQRQSRMIKGLLAALFAAAAVIHLGALDVLGAFQPALGWAAAVLLVLWDLTVAADLAGLTWTLDDLTPPALTPGAPGAPTSRSATGASAAVADPLVHQTDAVVFKDYVVDIYLAFVAWSILTALATLIWFFPLFNMSLSGEEAAVVSTLAPIVLGFSAVRTAVVHSQAFLGFLSLVAIGGFLVEAPNLRLLICGVGVAISLTQTIGTWFQGSVRRNRAVATWLLGLLLSLIVRVYCTTTNPLWPIMNDKNGGMQVPLLILAVIALIDVLVRPPVPAKIQDAAMTLGNPSGNAVAAGLGFGGALYTTHLLFTDTASLSRFMVSGYPDPGPAPFPHGLSVLVALSVGLLLSTRSRLVSSPLWWGAAAAGSAALVYGEGLAAYGGGLLLGVYVMSIWPRTISALTQKSPLVSLTVGLVLYNALLFAGVWTVAYAFVPMGWVLRERTDIVVGIALAAMLAGAAAGGGEALFYVAPVANASAGVATVQKQLVEHAKREQQRVLNSLAVLGLLAAAAAYTRLQPAPAATVLGAPNDKLITGGIWTIHFGYDNAMWSSHIRMANLIRDSQVDFVGLLESDTNRLFMGNRDVPLMVAEQLNMYLDYGPRTRDNTWGCALLSKFPIVKSKHYLLPSPEGELACAIHATLDLNGDHVDVLVAHNGQEETPLDRELQTRLEGEIMRNATNPIIFVGYVVTKPHQPQYKLLMDGTTVKDIDPTDTDRWCEYIAYKGLERVGYARISHGGITDTEMQVGRFRIGSGRDNTDEIPASEVPADLKFTPLFDGAGTRGHRYHVHDRPKYFGTKKPAARPAKKQRAAAAEAGAGAEADATAAPAV